MMDLITIGELKLVGLKVVGRVNELSHRVPMAWLELTAKLESIPHKADPELFYGVFPERDHLTNGVNGVHTYWVTAPVTAFGELPEGMVALTVPGGTYATATVQGDTPAAIHAVYTALWQATNGGGAPTDPDGFGFERYDCRRQPVTPPYPRFDFDICKPLLKPGDR